MDALHATRRGSGEPLLLIQGMSGTHVSWGEPFTAVLEDVFDVVAYDHRGIGYSPKTTDPFSIVDLADDAIGVLDAQGIESAHVVGISMGGMVAQELALRHGDRIRTLTLGCTYCGGPGSSLLAPEDAQKLSAGFMSGNRDLALRTGYELNLSEAFRADPANFEPFREMATSVPARVATIMLQMQAIAGHDTQARLAQIDRPTLVIHGSEDRMIPVANGELIASRIPDATLDVFEGVGHLWWWEQPERGADAIRAHAGVAARAA